MALSPPSSQLAADRPITFLIDDAVSGAGPADALTLYVRPEDLTRQEPSRVNIVQTLNSGAWGDSFGPGISMIVISGTTGWRRTINSDDDGEARFKQLRDQVFTQWHERRQRAVKSLRDPSDVRLVYSDALNDVVATVAPVNFTLRRSRSRPLLLQYQIQLAVLADGVGAYSPAYGLDSSLLTSLGLDSLTASLNRITSLANQAKSFIDRTILAPVQAFNALTQNLFTKVTTTIDAVLGVPASLLTVARTAAQAGANLYRTIAAVEGVPDQVAGYCIGMASAFSNVWCLLNNALAAPETYPDYSVVYGASNCSSTSGGEGISIFASENTFASIAPAPKPPIVAVTTSAQTSLGVLSSTDVVLAPMSQSEAATHAGNIAAGVVLNG